MRTDAEILARAKAIKEEDPFGFRVTDLLSVLPAEAVKPWVREDADLSEWKQDPRDRDAVLARIKDYLPFAWGKAQDHRGLSANRSIGHLEAWLWLLGDADYAAIDWDNYQNYGAPILKQISERYGAPMPDGSDALNMARGARCRAGCDEGCSGENP